MAWAVAMPGMLDPAAAHGLASSLPYGSEQLEDAMVRVDNMLSSVVRSTLAAVRQLLMLCT